MINSDIIHNYIKSLENEINKLKEQLIYKDQVINSNLTEIENLSKVSIITNLNKQLKEKSINIEILERNNEMLSRVNKELESDNKLSLNYKNTINELEQENEKKRKEVEFLENKLKVSDNRLFCLEEDIRKIQEEHSELINKLKILETNEKLKDDNDEFEDDNEEEYETITYKNIEYIIDKDNNVFSIKDNKPDKLVGIIKNNKVKLNK